MHAGMSAKPNTQSVGEVRTGEMLGGVVEGKSIEDEASAERKMASQCGGRVGASAGAEGKTIAIEPGVADLDATARDHVVHSPPGPWVRPLDADLRRDAKIECAYRSTGCHTDGGSKRLPQRCRVAAVPADALYGDGDG